MEAALNVGVVRKYGPADVKGAVRTLWLDAAEQASQHNQVAFALLPMLELLRNDSYLPALQAHGYPVGAPDSADALI